MIRYLIFIGLAISPFLLIKGIDQRYAKESFAIGISLAISLWGIYRGIVKPFNNKWLLLFLGYAYLITLFAPRWIGLNLNAGGNVDGLWNYKPLFYFTVYILAVVVIASMHWKDEVVVRIFKIMAYSGFIMAVIMLLQKVGISPFSTVKNLELSSMSRSPEMAGTLGNPTISSPFVLLCIPAALYLRKYLLIAVMLVAIVFSKSSVAITATLATSIFYFTFGNQIKFVSLLALLALAMALVIIKNPDILSGRMEVWNIAFNDMKATQTTFLTGFGIGAFGFLFCPLLHQNMPYWSEMHNEFFELMWGIGIIGLFLMLKSIYFVFKKSWTISKDEKVRCLTSILFAFCFVSLGTFIGHIGAFCIYLVVVVGILSSMINKNGRLACSV